MLLSPLTPETALDELVERLVEPGWCVLPGFVPAEMARELADQARLWQNEGLLSLAAIGRGDEAQVREAIRGDLTRWLEPGMTPATDRFLALSEQLRQALNASLFLGLEELESHYALYPPGAFYKKHLDRFRDDDRRTITIVLYLNEHWLPADGGELRLYLPDGSVQDVQPELGTLVCFRSALLPHEVRVAHRERLSLTGWFLRRGEIPW
ncbi:2OG-Fe(II) oxygenase [Atopomonas sediminilitoris]|uniref:2OG-Fe(II) oxygenase n=1 Tax=Atopomonas sediminilitoris TaxID=2919919 RepID=UPI003520552F